MPVLLFACGCVLSAAPEFPGFNDLKEPLLVPNGSEITIDRDGNYCLNGIPRFFIGTQIEQKIKAAMAPTAGYPPELKWLYEQVPDYRMMQRVGVDLLGYLVDDGWVREHVPKFRSFFFNETEMAEYRKLFREYRLPMYVDYTAAPWAQGVLSRLRKQASLPDEVFTSTGAMGSGQHWVPYCLANPQGRKLYLEYWAHGANQLKRYGGKALFYELLNEPAYYDPCPANRKQFVEFLKRKYRTADELNRVWKSRYPDFEEVGKFRRRTDNPGLFVDWCKFTEQQITEICREGNKLIRSIDPGARTCVQIMGGNNYRVLPNSCVNTYELSKFSDVISLPTAGGCAISDIGLESPASSALATRPLPPAMTEGILLRHYFRSIGEGKPIHDGECYSGFGKNSLHTVLWLQMARGGNAAYLFLWGKRAWEWKPAGSEQGGIRIAELLPFHILNPYGMATSKLTQIMQVKKEFLQLGDLLIPRNRKIPRETAVLLSFPSERMAQISGDLGKDAIRTYTAALEFSHVPMDVILEEQLAERSPRYRVIIAAGVRNIDPRTLEIMTQYVRRGGVLILGEQPFPEDEYGNPVARNEMLDFQTETVSSGTGTLNLQLPRCGLLDGAIQARLKNVPVSARNWKTVATLDGKPAVLCKRYGKGTVYFIGAEFPDYSLAALLAPILQKHGVNPVVRVIDSARGDLAVNVELHSAKNDSGMQAFLMFNWDKYPKTVRLEAESFRTAGRAADLYAGRELAIRNGGVTVLLPPHMRTVVVNGPAKEHLARFGAFPSQTDADLAERIRSATPKKEPKTREDRVVYSPDLRCTRPLDLRRFCNRGFTDRIAGDGKGGWTDQGSTNSLRGVPWGIHTFNGVPCEIIRFDQNDDRTCMVFDSKHLAEGFGLKSSGEIPVHAKLRNVFAFQTGAWVQGTSRLTYRLHYVDGSHRDLSAPVYNWWISKHDRKEAAWINSENRGFFIRKLPNPEPGKEVKSLEIVSSSRDAIPIVIAVTVEEMPDQKKQIPLPPTWKTGTWNGAKLHSQNGVYRLESGKDVKDWAGMSFRAPSGGDGLALPESGEFVLEIASLRDSWNNPVSGQSIQFFLHIQRADGKVIHSRKLNLKSGIPSREIRPGAQTARFPLTKLYAPAPGDRLRLLSIQFVGLAPEAGVEIRNIRFEE